MLWTTDKILQATGGRWVGGERGCEFSGISIDSRTSAGDHLFVAIEGDVHDGHEFIEDVIRKGIRGVIASKAYGGGFADRDWPHKEVACISVEDTTVALGDLAAFLRRSLTVSVVAITGSNGKTTTRGMISAVLSQRYRTLSTRGNFNNLIGLPLTLFGLDETHDWAVLELGMNRPGEIGRLGTICRPNIGVITNIGPAHLEGFESIEGIMRAKGELVDTLEPEGVLVLNVDDRRVQQIAQDAPHAVLTFGRCPNADIRARGISSTVDGTDFDLMLPSGVFPIHLGSPGEFMVLNSLAAAAVGYRLEMTGREIKAGLESFTPEGGRMNILHTGIGVHLVDDTYNANPGSMEAAIHTLRSLKGAGRCALVTGDMLELGRFAESMHRDLGIRAVQSDVDRIYATGSFADAVAAGARDAGMSSDRIRVGTHEQILAGLVQWLRPDDWVLVKGSRKMKMETISQGLRDWADRDRDKG
jgi:UDP-N-acetylmuramoyl-tripeptide--D-alanyl-D-alanine ligase